MLTGFLLLVLMLSGCRKTGIWSDFFLLKHRFDNISNLTLDTVYLEKDTVHLAYTDHSGYYDPHSIDEQFIYLIMLNEDYMKHRIICYRIRVAGNSELEPSIIEGCCSFEQIRNTRAYEVFTKSSFYREVLNRLYSSRYYPYHFLMLNWNYGYELSITKDPGRFYNANSTELIRNFIVNKTVCDPIIDNIWYNVLQKEMRIHSVNPEFDKEKKELLLYITNYRRKESL